MKFLKTKILIAVFFIIFINFFSNDFGLIDIEKTAIVTAVAIDTSEDNLYEVTCEIAVPEAVDTNTENKKTEISASGDTVGKAIKEIGEKTGWYPQLYFCNLVILSESLSNENAIYVLDYFAKTLRVQDSAEVVLANGKAKDLLKASTPLDNISSFAIQKILLKNKGFDGDIANMNIKTFSNDYYSRTSSSYMPIIVTENAESNTSTQQSSSLIGQSSSETNEEKKTFSASTTALFIKGKKVGELNNNQTLCYNLLTKSLTGTSFSITSIEDGKQTNYLLTVNNNKRKMKLKATENQLKLDIFLDITVVLVDKNGENFEPVSKGNKIREDIQILVQEKFISLINELLDISKTTNCDFLKIDNLLYRYNHKYYDKYKDNLLQSLTSTLNISVSGQK